MFQSRNNSFVPHFGIPPLNSALLAAANERAGDHLAPPVQTMDIYQAARNRAIEDHELDKLFNPQYYDDQV